MKLLPRPPKPSGMRGHVQLFRRAGVPIIYLNDLDTAPDWDDGEASQEFKRTVHRLARGPKPPESAEAREARRLRKWEERLERHRQYKEDIGDAARRQRLVVKLHGALFGPVVSRGKPSEPPGLLDQFHGAQSRVWRMRQASRLRRNQRLELGLKHGEYESYAVTLARPGWILDEPDETILPKIRKEVQRQSKRLRLPYVVTGVIDVCPLRDVLSGTEGWAFHVHLTVQLAVSNYAAGKKAISKAYPYKRDSDHGVPRGRVVKHAFDVRGWDSYQDKLFQYGGVKLRTVKVDDLSGKRKRAIKRTMLVSQQAELAIFFGKIKADDLMIWVGHRRYGDRVLPMRRN